MHRAHVELPPEVSQGGHVYVSEAVNPHQPNQRITASEARLQGIIASAMDAIISINSEQRVVVFNPAAERLFGIKVSEALGKNVNEFIPKRYRETHVQHVKRFGATGVSNRKMGQLGTLTALRANGEEFPIEASISQVEVDGEKLFTVILRDISERQQTDSALQRQADLIDLTPNAIIVRNLEGVIFLWSRGAEALYGWKREEVLGRRVAEVLKTEFPEPFAAIVHSLKQTGRWSGELKHYTKDNRLVVVESWWLSRTGPGGDLGDILESNMDITERRQFQEKLERTVAERTARLRETIGDLEHFSYTITHDMRAPLRAMQAFGEILRGEYWDRLDEPGRDYLRRIIEASERMDHLITDALNYTKVIREELRLEPVNLQELLRSMLDSYPEFHPPRADVQVVDGIPPVVGNRAALTQCFSNLLGNAVKFVTAGKLPVVRVSSEGRGEDVRIWVEDNGIGIHPEEQGRLFRMFERLSNDYEGTGIGLALVKKVVERMKGSVGVESTPGVGSRFWVELKQA